MLGVFGGFITAMVTIFKQNWAPVTAPIYALLEGLFLGGISAFFEQRYPGIAIQAVGLTFGALLTMLVRLQHRLDPGDQQAPHRHHRGHRRHRAVLPARDGPGFLRTSSSSQSMDPGPIGIGFSLFVCAIAAFNLVLDFDFIEQGVNYGAPKYMEWYGAFGIMVTLVWLYLEILRLLSKMRSRN